MERIKPSFSTGCVMRQPVQRICLTGLNRAALREYGLFEARETAYQQRMHEELTRRFGKDFIPRAQAEAKKIYDAKAKRAAKDGKAQPGVEAPVPIPGL